ncbi:MAG: hypothetical protein CAF45_007865 [Nitrospira sp. CG24E]|nr:MAG: hypothetical protein CAF45_007865 [Nitrospira sp. CG24E]
MRVRFPHGIPMKDGTTSQTFPYPEGSPDKPDWIAQDPIASAEWERICASLAARRALSPAWMGIITAAASAFASFLSLEKEIATHGRVEGADALLGSMLSTYHLACKECQVEPNEAMRLHVITEGT